MAGIYVHIPFCRKLCYYCDFHFTVSLKEKDAVMESILKEISLQKNYLGNEIIETIYLGGGTPSVLNSDELNEIFGTIYRYFKISDNVEITMEVNPDDLQPEYLKRLYRESPVKRLSIGIQSFRDEDLKKMNRRHTAQEAITAVRNSQAAGFSNINIDLIYGIPGLTMDGWKKNLEQALNMDIQHISAYHLTFEPKTVFWRYLSQGKIKPVKESLSIKQFEWLIQETAAHGFIHYEISNFAREGYLSKHNTNYWKQKKYLGIGPSAHSYNLTSRQWNIANNSKYTESLKNNLIPFEIEELGPETKYNDYLLTSLRTMWGADINHINKSIGEKYANHFLQHSVKFIDNGDMVRNGDTFILSLKGKFLSDYIISELMYVGE
jgi:oxygen-independent coproporphyrinogen III oxidase